MSDQFKFDIRVIMIGLDYIFNFEEYFIVVTYPIKRNMLS